MSDEIVELCGDQRGQRFEGSRHAAEEEEEPALRSAAGALEVEDSLGSNA